MLQNYQLNTVQIQNNTISLKQYLSLSNFTWIGVHVRRTGSYSDSTSDDSHIFKAMRYFSTKYRKCIFIMASDDKNYCMRTFGKQKNVIITPRHFSLSEDLAALALCQHSIITTGSFGWWSAFLAGGNVLHNIRYIQNTSTTYDCNSDDYIPPWFLQFR